MNIYSVAGSKLRYIVAYYGLFYKFQFVHVIILVTGL
jgi:hypothetical protein